MTETERIRIRKIAAAVVAHRAAHWPTTAGKKEGRLGLIPQPLTPVEVQWEAICAEFPPTIGPERPAWLS